MKRIWILLLMLSIFILVSCSNDETVHFQEVEECINIHENYYEYNAYEQINSSLMNLSHGLTTYELTGRVFQQRIIPYGQRTLEHFLYDLNYILHVLYENFPIFESVYQYRGVNIRAIIERTRVQLLSIEYMDRDLFYDILYVNFANLFNRGHFNIFPPQGAVHTLERATQIEEILSIFENRERIRPPLVERFLRIERMWNQGFITHDDALGKLNSYFRDYRLAHDLLDAFVYESILEALEIFWIWHNEIEQYREEVAVKIIENNKIAYISIERFAARTHIDYRDLVFNFFGEIQNFDHLIIDLRGNGGGDPKVFKYLILEPNISESWRIEGYAFLRYGNYTDKRLIRSFYQRSGMNLTYRNWMRLTQDDDLNYFNRFYTIINPNLLSKFGYQPAFSGKIWLLIDGFTGSAAQVATWLVYEMGFATLVGDISGGNAGGPRTHRIHLPYSRIILSFDMSKTTDSQGRPLEAGTIPHHFNRPGMDALETVLVLISEGHHYKTKL